MVKDDDVMRHWKGDDVPYTEEKEMPSLLSVTFWGCIFTLIAILFNLLISS